MALLLSFLIYPRMQKTVLSKDFTSHSRFSKVVTLSEAFNFRIYMQIFSCKSEIPFLPPTPWASHRLQDNQQQPVTLS
jgi:hypothetical protein